MTTVDAVSGAVAPRIPWRARFTRLQSRYPILQLLVLAIVVAVGASLLPGLLEPASIRTMLVLAALCGLASIGQTLLILMGGFDLSISGFMVASALAATSLKHVGFVTGLVGAVVACGLLGALAGQICHRYDVQPLIVTFATGTIAAGTIQVLNGGLIVGGSPAWITRLSSPIATTFGLPIAPVVAMWFVATVLLALFTHRTRAGRRLLVTGAGLAAAELSLVRTRRVWTIAFAASGVLSALAGILVGGFAGSITSTVADPYVFQSVVAVVVGGTVFGGPGGFTRTFIGTLILTVTTTVFVGKGAPLAGQYVLNGLVLAVALTAYGRQRRIRDRI